MTYDTWNMTYDIWNICVWNILLCMEYIIYYAVWNMTYALAAIVFSVHIHNQARVPGGQQFVNMYICIHVYMHICILCGLMIVSARG